MPSPTRSVRHHPGLGFTKSGFKSGHWPGTQWATLGKKSTLTLPLQCSLEHRLWQLGAASSTPRSRISTGPDPSSNLRRAGCSQAKKPVLLNAYSSSRSYLTERRNTKLQARRMTLASEAQWQILRSAAAAGKKFQYLEEPDTL